MFRSSDIRGDYQLVAGKNAMLVRGCPKCGHSGHCSLGTVVTILEIQSSGYLQCGKCRTDYLVTLMKARLLDGKRLSTCTYLWKPMPDLDIEEEKKTEQLERAVDKINKFASRYGVGKYPFHEYKD